VTRFQAPVATRVADVTTDRVLRNHDERIRELVRRVQDLETSVGDVSRFLTVIIGQAITAAGDRVALKASATPLVVVELICAGATTLTSTPNIDPGTLDGQLLILRRNRAGANLTLSDASGVAGSGLRLAGAANQAIGSGDLIVLLWRASTLEWWQVVPVVAT
jgi:hypothetical protein